MQHYYALPMYQIENTAYNFNNFWGGKEEREKRRE
jgi:hypothetical protein